MTVNYKHRAIVWLLVTIFPISIGTAFLIQNIIIGGILEYLVAIYGIYNIMINWSLLKQKEPLW